MWTVNALDVIHLGRTPGGDKFTEIVNALICAQAHVCGIPLSEIRTNLRTNIPDGGVDTEVIRPVPNDPTGWLRDYPTLWQFKARQASDIHPGDLKKEINDKKYVQQLIKNGYAYRLCLCDSIPSEKQEEWETLLTEEIHNIAPSAPVARVLSADNLAHWISHFPGIVARYFRPNLGGICFHFETWKTSITSDTRLFVPVAEWDEIQTRIVRHMDFTIETPEVTLPISGVAGVGKTRLAFEALASLTNAQYLVVYTEDENNAAQVAHHLANDSDAQAILVADECDVRQRVRLQNILRGARNRVRVITIDNSGERPASEAQESWVEKIPVSILEEILSRNFPDVPPERRRYYASISGGFVRWAADRCRNDARIAQTGRAGIAIPSESEYLRRRLNEEGLEVIQALSLVTKVGRSGDVEEQLRDLCTLADLDLQRFKRIANMLHDRPGFVGRAGQFFYVTPEIVAHIAFDMAWNRWAKEDPAGFLSRIPPSLIDVFNGRVATVPNEEVRRVVGDFFRRWANSLKPAQLASEADVDQLNTLLEIEPQNYLPVLRRLVEEATIDELLAVTERGSNGRWGPRRLLVWAAERLAAFPEYFDDAEAILLRLALAESEPHISNNATGIWRQLFRIELSGTSVPFMERLDRLEERLFSRDSAVSSLALDALKGIFDPHATRMVGPTVVAGRISPDEWEPASVAEHKKCFDSSIALLQKAVLNDSFSVDLREKARNIALSYVRLFLGYRYLKEMQALFSQASLSDEAHVRLIKAVEEFLFFEGGKYNGQISVPEDYLSEVSVWLDSLRPTDFHGRLVSLIGIDPWHHSRVKSEDRWRDEIRSLALRCFEKFDELKKEIEWLYSPQAQSASILGEEVGKLDKDAQLLPLILESSVTFRSTEFARGYINNLLRYYPEHASQVNAEIDNIQESLPEHAYELFTAGGDLTRSLQRAIDLVKAKKLDTVYLKRFVYGVWSRQLSLEELENVLNLLLNNAESGDKSAGGVAIEFIAFRLIDDKQREAEPVLAQDRIRSLAWILMEISAEDAGGETYWWPEVLRSLIHYDPERTARIAASGIVADNIEHREACKSILNELATEHPDMVLKHVGKMVLGSDRGWRFYIGDYRGIILSLPTDLVIDWIKVNGVESARRIARQLPKPTINHQGEAVVPLLTRFVLEEFEDDDSVFSAFCGVSTPVLVGSPIPYYEGKAAIAEKFLNHPLKRIREWAQREITVWRQMADSERQYEEEEAIEFK